MSEIGIASLVLSQIWDIIQEQGWIYLLTLVNSKRIWQPTQHNPLRPSNSTDPWESQMYKTPSRPKTNMDPYHTIKTHRTSSISFQNLRPPTNANPFTSRSIPSIPPPTSPIPHVTPIPVVHTFNTTMSLDPSSPRISFIWITSSRYIEWKSGWMIQFTWIVDALELMVNALTAWGGL